MDDREYKKLSQFKADIDLMVSNAKKYNLNESQVYNDAVKIQVKFILQNIAELHLIKCFMYIEICKAMETA